MTRVMWWMQSTISREYSLLTCDYDWIITRLFDWVGIHMHSSAAHVWHIHKSSFINHTVAGAPVAVCLS